MKTIFGVTGAVAGATLGLAGGFVAAKALLRGEQAEPVTGRQLADPDSEFANIDGLEIHLIRSTNEVGGLPLICVHGVAASTVTWRPVSDRFGDLLDVVCFDRPGFGLSERPRRSRQARQKGKKHSVEVGRDVGNGVLNQLTDFDPIWGKDGGPYSMERSVSLIFAVADHLGADQFLLMGHSQGGTIAAVAAAREPHRIAGLILESPAFELAIPNVAFSTLQTLRKISFGPKAVKFIQNLDDRHFGFVWNDISKLTPEVVALYRRPMQIHGWEEAFWEHLCAFRMPDLSDKVLTKLIGIPTLVITGDKDRIVPTSSTIRTAERLMGLGVDSRLVIVSNCGHISHEESPQEFFDEVHQFLSDHKLLPAIDQ